MGFGEHTIGVIEINDKDIFNSNKKLGEHVLKACKICNLNVVGEKCHVFDNPKSMTYCLILSQSHFIIHTWPEESKLLFDIFTCSNKKNAKECIKVLADHINGEICSIKTIKI